MKGELSLLNPFTQTQMTEGSGFFPSIRFLYTLTGMMQSELLENVLWEIIFLTVYYT